MKRERNVNEIEISDWLWLENLFHIIIFSTQCILTCVIAFMKRNADAYSIQSFYR